MEWIVKSSDGRKSYTVEKFGSRWVCSCPSFRFNCHTSEGLKADNNGSDRHKRRFCKHILKIKEGIQ